MGSRVVVQPNGKLAIFSTIVDDFTAIDATPEEIAEIFIRDAIESARELAKRALEMAIRQEATRWKDAIETIKVVHGEKVAAERQRDGGGGR